MFASKSEWSYCIVKDVFQIPFPEGDYDLETLLDWYKVIPTNPQKISYYGDNEELLKRHFNNFSTFDEVKTKLTNDFHSNSILTVWCMAIYDTEEELIGFSAQEYIGHKAEEKKISFFGL